MGANSQHHVKIAGMQSMCVCVCTAIDCANGCANTVRTLREHLCEHPGCSPQPKCVNTSPSSGVHHISPRPPHAECVNVLTQALVPGWVYRNARANNETVSDGAAPEGAASPRDT